MKLDLVHTDFAASWVSSTSTAAFTYPFDTLKVFWQANGSRPRDTIKSIGFLGLYRGIQVTFLVNGITISIVFTMDEYWRRVLGATYGITGLAQPFFAGVLAGVCGSVVICPIVNLKTRLQIHSGSALGAARALGVRGLYRAYYAEVVACSIGRGTYFFSYEATKVYLGGVDTEQKWWHSVAAAMVTGVAGWTVVFSLDLVKTKVQATPERYRGLYDCALQTYRSLGWRGFWVVGLFLVGWLFILWEQNLSRGPGLRGGG